MATAERSISRRYKKGFAARSRPSSVPQPVAARHNTAASATLTAIPTTRLREKCPEQ